MTREEAIKEAVMLSTTGKVNLDVSIHVNDGEVTLEYYSIYLDDFAFGGSCKESWQGCIDELRSMDLIEEKQRRIEQLRRELAEMEAL